MIDRCVEDLEECMCECHFNEYVEHIIPCCEQCRYCEKRIKISATLHEMRCPDNPQNKEEKK